MKRAALLTIVAGALGCSARTELVVGIVTDLDAPDPMQHVTLEAFRADDDSLLLGQEWDLSGTPSEVYNLPGSYGLVADDGSPTIKLLLKGVGPDFRRLERRATVQLLEGETLFMRMSLVGNCRDREDCAEGETCVEGFCASPAVNAKQLPSFSDSLISTLTCDGGIRYIDTATKMPLPLSDDAAQCPADLCRDGLCLAPLPPTNERREVTGRAINTYIVPGATTTQSEVLDLSAITIEALVPNGAGGYQVFPGTGTVAGSFSIPDVPDGEYILHIDRRYLVSTSAEWDIGSTHQNRRGLIPAPVNTTITVNVTNLAPLQGGDVLRVVVPAARNFFQPTFTVIPPPLATDVNNALVETWNQSGNLMTMDAYEIQQIDVRTVGTQSYGAIVRRAAGTVTLAAGSSTTIGGTMEPLQQDQMFSGEFAGTAWDTALGWNGTNVSAIHPRATQVVPQRVYITQARDGDGSSILDHPTGLILDTTFGHGADVTFGPLIYAAASADPQFVTFTGDPLIAIRHPSATIDGFIAAPYGYTERLSDHAGPIHPRMSPPQELTIDDKAAFTQGQTTSITPSLRWTRPLLGTPTSYQIQVFRVGFDGGSGTTVIDRDPVAFLHTPNTEITLPPGILTAGEYYVFYVNATSGAVSNSPFRKRLPIAFAPVASELFQAQ